MTNSEKLALWQGLILHRHDKDAPKKSHGICTCGMDFTSNWNLQDHLEENHDPDYLNDDAAAMSLLDTLVEKGLSPALEYSVDEQCWILSVVPFNQQGYYVCEDVEEYLAKTRREAVVAACLELIGKEMEG